MKLLRTVAIKQIVTENKKSSIIHDYEEKIKAYKHEINQLIFQLHKAKKTAISTDEQQEIRKRYKHEIKQREEKINSMLFNIKQAGLLEIGSEIREGTMNTIVDIRIGDNWDDSIEDEIIIKDGVVNEIRENRKKE